MREKLGILGWTLFACVLFCIVWLILGGFGLVTEPFMLNQENKIVHASNSYITTQKTQLETMAESYRAVEVRRAATNDPDLRQALDAQAQGIINQMRTIAILIPDDVPSDVNAILYGGGR